MSRIVHKTTTSCFNLGSNNISGYGVDYLSTGSPQAASSMILTLASMTILIATVVQSLQRSSKINKQSLIKTLLYIISFKKISGYNLVSLGLSNFYPSVG